MRIAPIFDCGSCLYPQLPTESYAEILRSREEIEARVYMFPNSSIRMNGKRINYHDYLTSCVNPECNDALRRVVPRVDLDRIQGFIDGCEALSEIQKEFYFTMLYERKRLILDPAFEKAESRD